MARRGHPWSAAGETNVLVHGRWNRQLAIAGGVLDEVELDVIPVLFGRGCRLFEARAAEQIELERSRILEGDNGVTTCATRSGDEFSGVAMS